MSSRVRSCIGTIAVAAAAVTLAACGGDSEPAAEVAGRDTVATLPGTAPETQASTAAAERAARRAAARRKAAARRAARLKAAAARERRERVRRQRAARAERERVLRERQQAAEAAAQRTTTVETTPAPPEPAGPVPHQVVETANLQLVSKRGTAFVQEGAVTGTLAGTMRLDAKLGGQGVEGSFTVKLPDGTMDGTAAAALTLAGARATFKGTATMTSGTGAYKALKPAQVAFSGWVKSDASTSAVKLAGTLTW